MVGVHTPMKLSKKCFERSHGASLYVEGEGLILQTPHVGLKDQSSFHEHPSFRGHNARYPDAFAPKSAEVSKGLIHWEGRGPLTGSTWMQSNCRRTKARVER